MKKVLGTFHLNDIRNPWWECHFCGKKVEYGDDHVHDDLHTYTLKPGQTVHIGGFPVKLLFPTVIESGTKIFEDKQ